MIFCFLVFSLCQWYFFPHFRQKYILILWWASLREAQEWKWKGRLRYHLPDSGGKSVRLALYSQLVRVLMGKVGDLDCSPSSFEHLCILYKMEWLQQERQRHTPPNTILLNYAQSDLLHQWSSTFSGLGHPIKCGGTPGKEQLLVLPQLTWLHLSQFLLPGRAVKLWWNCPMLHSQPEEGCHVCMLLFHVGSDQPKACRSYLVLCSSFWLGNPQHFSQKQKQTGSSTVPGYGTCVEKDVWSGPDSCMAWDSFVACFKLIKEP